MKIRKTKVIATGIIILVLCIFLFKDKKSSNQDFEEELIFFKWFSLSKTNSKNKQKTTKQEITNHPQYVFHVWYKNIDFKEICLADTINKKTLIHEKIAPRNKGRIYNLFRNQ